MDRIIVSACIQAAGIGSRGGRALRHGEDQMSEQELSVLRATVARMQKIVYSILCDVDDFCRENHITYFLSGGSCLGAARHQGFIPWDEDGDIMMPRKDYDRFMELFPRQFKDKYGVGALAIDPKWNRQWGKIWDLNTTLKYKHYRNHDIGVFIDVYPIDGVPSSPRAQKRFYLHQKILAEFAKDCERKGYIPRLKYVRLRKFICHFTRPIGVRYFVERIDKLARKYDFDTSEFVACSVPVHYGSRETIRHDCMATATLLPFEGRMFPVPVGYKVYLSNLYGDYMKPPEEPEEERYTHLVGWEVSFDTRGRS